MRLEELLREDCLSALRRHRRHLKDCAIFIQPFEAGPPRRMVRIPVQHERERKFLNVEYGSTLHVEVTITAPVQAHLDELRGSGKFEQALEQTKRKWRGVIHVN